MKLDVEMFNSGFEKGAASIGDVAGFMFKKRMADKAIQAMTPQSPVQSTRGSSPELTLGSEDPIVKELLADPAASKYIQGVLTGHTLHE